MFEYNHRTALKIEPSGVPDIDLIGPGTVEFRGALEFLLGREPDAALRLAARYSVIVRNRAARAIALLGVRFDMIAKQGRESSVVHYADTLRNPEKAAVTPGAVRFICAEPLYTGLVLGQRASQPEADRRARMNLDNLAKAREIRASVDCVAFDDGHFAGPDSLGAFDRLRLEREAEIAFVEELLKAGAEVEDLLIRAMDVAAQRTLARRLHEGLQTGGPSEMTARARRHRPRIGLTR
jgi:hypothetical protein